MSGKKTIFHETNSSFLEKFLGMRHKEVQIQGNYLINSSLSYPIQLYNEVLEFCKIISANSNNFWDLGSQDTPLFLHVCPPPLPPTKKEMGT